MGSAWGVGDAHGAPPAKRQPPRTRLNHLTASVKEPIRLTPEGLRLGMMANDVVAIYNKVLDQDYVPIYKMTPIGPKMKEVDAALAEQKLAFPRARSSSAPSPPGDNTPLKDEYNYKNNETMMSISRQGVTRYFFFVGKRLWKIYDVLPLKKEGDMGACTRNALRS